MATFCLKSGTVLFTVIVCILGRVSGGSGNADPNPSLTSTIYQGIMRETGRALRNSFIEFVKTPDFIKITDIFIERVIPLLSNPAKIDEFKNAIDSLANNPELLQGLGIDEQRIGEAFKGPQVMDFFKLGLKALKDMGSPSSSSGPPDFDAEAEAFYPDQEPSSSFGGGAAGVNYLKILEQVTNTAQSFMGSKWDSKNDEL